MEGNIARPLLQDAQEPILPVMPGGRGRWFGRYAMFAFFAATVAFALSWQSVKPRICTHYKGEMNVLTQWIECRPICLDIKIDEGDITNVNAKLETAKSIKEFNLVGSELCVLEEKFKNLSLHCIVSSQNFPKVYAQDRDQKIEELSTTLLKIEQSITQVCKNIEKIKLESSKFPIIENVKSAISTISKAKADIEKNDGKACGGGSEYNAECNAQVPAHKEMNKQAYRFSRTSIHNAEIHAKKLLSILENFVTVDSTTSEVLKDAETEATLMVVNVQGVEDCLYNGKHSCMPVWPARGNVDINALKEKTRSVPHDLQKLPKEMFVCNCESFE